MQRSFLRQAATLEAEQDNESWNTSDSVAVIKGLSKTLELALDASNARPTLLLRCAPARILFLPPSSTHRWTYARLCRVQDVFEKVHQEPGLAMALEGPREPTDLSRLHKELKQLVGPPLVSRRRPILPASLARLCSDSRKSRRGARLHAFAL